MADHPNAELFRKGYAAFQTGDLDTLRSLFADDLEWTFPGHNQFSGTLRGPDQVLGAFGQQMQETDGTLKVEVHDIVANDTHAVALATFSAQRNGKSVSDRYTHVAHIVDGKVAQSWIFQENPDKVDELWS